MYVGLIQNKLQFPYSWQWRNISPSETLCLIDVFLIVSDQQWRSTVWDRGISYIRLWLDRQYLLEGSLHCWFWSFHEFCCPKEKYRIWPDQSFNLFWSDVILLKSQDLMALGWFGFHYSSPGGFDAPHTERWVFMNIQQIDSSNVSTGVWLSFEAAPYILW